MADGQEVSNDEENSIEHKQQQQNDDTMTTTTTKTTKPMMKNTPSFLSPVGAMSRNYLMAHDDDDIIDRSPMIVRHHRKYPHRHNIRRNNNGRYWDNDYEANYNEFGVTQQTDVTALHEEYKHDNNTSSNTIIDNDDLPTPLLDHRGYRDRQQHDLNTDDYLVCSPSRIQTPQEEQTMEQQLHRHRLHQEKPKLNGLNYLNVITYILNVFTSYFIGVCGLFGVLPTRRDIFIEYETLVTVRA